MMLVSLASLVALVLLFGAAVGVVYVAIRSSEVARTGTLQDPCAANLAAIGQAMLQYHNANGRFPPAVVRDAGGRPMHSWRVLLLPYLGQESLFHQYNMSVPWSDPQNQLLVAQMPAVYHCPTSFNVASSETSYVVITSPDGVFRDAESASLLEIHDGPDTTLLVVETTGGAINWLEPRDLSSDTMSQTVNGPTAGGISSQHNGRAHVLMADGSVKFLSNLTSPETLEALLTIDANDTAAE